MKLKDAEVNIIYEMKSPDLSWNKVVFIFLGIIDNYYQIEILENSTNLIGPGSGNIEETSHIDNVSYITKLGTKQENPEYFL